MDNQSRRPPDYGNYHYNTDSTNASPGPSWVAIAICMIVFWPVGLFLLFKRLRNETAPLERYTEGTTAKSLDTSRTKHRRWGAIACFVMSALLLTGSWSVSSHFAYTNLVVGLLVGSAGGFLLYLNGKEKNKWMRYLSIINMHAPEVSLDYVAKHYGVDYKFVVQDVQEMIGFGLLKDAFIDYPGRQIVFPSNGGMAALTPAEEPGAETEEEAMDVKDRQLAAIRACRRVSKSPEFREKLELLESFTEKIYARLEEESDDDKDVLRFREQYLPRVIKALETYTQLTEREIPGSEAELLKRQIERSVDEFLPAFANILEKLYQDDMADVATDLSALRAALSREGWMEDGSPVDEESDLR